MILQSLHKLYQRIADDPAYGIAPPGYSVQKISFKVVLKPSGELFAIEDAQTPVAGKLRPQQLPVPGTGKPPGQGINPCFLWDNTGYMLGYKPDDPKPERSRKTFEAFRARHLGLEQAINCHAFSAVCRFLEQWSPDMAAVHPVLAETTAGFGVFQLLGETAYVHETERIRQWWEAENAGTSDAPVGQCLVTGTRVPIARLHPKVSGIPGGQPQKSLVGFEPDAFKSYGKQRSYNAPVGEKTAVQYVAALNALLDGPMHSRHRFSLGDMTVAFWTDKPTVTEDIFAQFCSGRSPVVDEGNGQDEALRQKLECFLKALRQGQEAYGGLADEVQTPFFLLGLAPNAARLSVRFFHSGTLAELLGNLRRHFRDISVVPQWGEGAKRPDPEFPPLRRLLDETCPTKGGRPDRDKIPPVLSGPLLRAVITGARYPDGLFSAVLRRMHADRKVNYIRACIVKGHLVRNCNQEATMSLDKNNENPAYRLGRLFAVLEKIQEEAHQQQTHRPPDKTIRDTYFGTACATPVAVFPRIERLSTHHRRHLSYGRKVFFDRLIGDIKWGQVVPKNVMSMAEQASFILGYYHQRKNLFTKAEVE